MSAENSCEDTRPTPLDLPRFLPYACAQLQAPFGLRVSVTVQDEYFSKTGEDKPKKLKAGKSAMLATSRTIESPLRDSPSGLDEEQADASVPLEVELDAGGRAVGLALRRAAAPRLLLQLLALCLRYQPLLARLELRWSALDAGALHELAKLPALTHVTELSLDDSPVAGGRYDLLLDAPAPLRRLSLARCELDDAECAALAARLRHPLPAATALLMLSLPGNRIGDAGAAALGLALRSNRSLQYLNLSGNRITDDGAAELLASLDEFPLTAEELVGRRARVFEYLRARDELTKKFYEELSALGAVERSADDGRGGRRKTAAPSPRGRKSTLSAGQAGAGAGAGAEALRARAQALAAEALGACAEPFGPEETAARGGLEYCAGNSTLCALSLAYNALGRASARRLGAALRRQAARRGAGPGLLRVALDGNPLPAGEALRLADELLDRAVSARLAKGLRKPERSAHVGKAKPK